MKFVPSLDSSVSSANRVTNGTLHPQRVVRLTCWVYFLCAYALLDRLSSGTAEVLLLGCACVAAGVLLIAVLVILWRMQAAAMNRIQLLEQQLPPRKV